MNRKWIRRLLALGLGLLVIVGIGMVWLQTSIYQPSKSAQLALSTAQSKSDYYLLEDKQVKKKQSIILYPGALVDSGSYGIWAEQLAKQGYRVYLLKAPFSLAILDANQADKVISQNKGERFYLAGHSLGGVIASRYASKHPKEIAGMIYLASYPDKKGSLAQKNIPVLSITASNDGVLNWKNYREAKKYLPKNTTSYSIAGGNHGGFGSYGKQKGDKSANISNLNQQKQISTEIDRWIVSQNNN
ncbi:alpha/beta fold hydrolase [Weissella muntiaci]|nr:alpha/beta fold hydrolase [Weissella muntiaci]